MDVKIGDRKAEIYTYESENVVYGLSWSVSHTPLRKVVYVHVGSHAGASAQTLERFLLRIASAELYLPLTLLNTPAAITCTTHCRSDPNSVHACAESPRQEVSIGSW